MDMATSTINKPLPYKGFGNAIDLGSSTTANPYVFPTDGVVFAHCSLAAGAYALCSLFNADGTSAGAISATGNTSGTLATEPYSAVPVFAGMKASVDGRIAGSGSYIRFRPFI